MNRSIFLLLTLTFVSCSPSLEKRQLAFVHAVGVTGSGRVDDAYAQIESTLDGLTEIFRRQGFSWPGKEWARSHGKKYEYAWYLTGERAYSLGYVYQPSEHAFAQCAVTIDRKMAKLRFFESEWPFKSGQFPMTDEQREHIRTTARVAADYLRRKLPSHDVRISFRQ